MLHSPEPLIDIGLNLASKAFEGEQEAVLQRAQEAGVQHCILTGTDLSASEQVAELCQQYTKSFPGMLYSTAGVHPHHASEWNTSSSDAIRALAALPQVVAIGETGLDFNRNFSTPEEQQRAFEAQLQLAAELRLSVFMHERDAHQRQLEILREYRDHLVDGVIHCFTGSKQALFNYLDMDLHIGITGWVCDERRDTELQKLVKNIPLERLMLESDAPYLLPRNIDPMPKDLKKSRRNEPAFLPWVLKEMSRHYGLSEEEIAVGTTATAKRFFRF
ncbi:TatD family hydrolase [Porticoccus sp. W117]|uniref:TatD family hydrolase n=1 Tax=Porticoccus sp. W117 TaxID=3054777 RepID=UPI002598E96D|nr:TatD family hydrolase [Porticoccus sp. W117]MDM3870330.1 TatD family hydrolase [Porticoccus sp. W117]